MDREDHRRFWEKVNKSGNCWEWTAATFTQMGYGEFWLNGNKYAHRVSWQIHNGEIPEGELVLHHCDNPVCVNPSHLYLGDASDNMQDMAKRSENAGMFKEGHDRGKETRFEPGHESPHRKLTQEQADKIRERYKKGGVTYSELGDEYGVTKNTIMNIIKGRTY
jgi:hypothetical protein